MIKFQSLPDRLLSLCVITSLLMTGVFTMRADAAKRPQNQEKDVNHAVKDAGKTKRPPARDPRKMGYVLSFADDFNGKSLDTSKWIDSYPDNNRTHSNGELQYYAPDGYFVKNGHLSLQALKRAMGGMTYTSGMIASYGHFSQKYGWFEIRARFPQGKGMWPAFWLLPDNKQWPPEIDILEILGHEPSKVYLTNHYSINGKHEGKGGNFTGPDFSADFHTFAVEWKPDMLIWYVDGQEQYRTTENIPAMPMYVIANLAVGGDWPGSPDAGTRFPGLMDIDYIRVYRHKSTGVASR
jgi:beta-glucanase (GH16 family)